MRKKLFTLCLILLTSIAFAQATYEKGYYVDKSGAKIAGYIKIIDFESINDINSLDFKKELNDKNSKLELNNVTEFGVGTELKYQKATFQIDDVNLFKELNDQKELNYKTSTLFLNVLVEGEASLYAIAGSNGTKYFYKVDKKNNNAITQLTYKKYFADGIVKENTFFRNQLFMDVKCENQVFNDFIN